MAKKFGKNWRWLCLMAAMFLLLSFGSFNIRAEENGAVLGPANDAIDGSSIDGSAMDDVTNSVDYGGRPAVDHDFDGLTDVGERELYQTDPALADTDGDRFLDGVEVIADTDPLDALSNTDTIEAENDSQPMKTSWAWYVTRSSGILALILMYLSFLFGFGMRLPLLQKLMKPASIMSCHRWVSVQAMLFMIVHLAAPLLDKHFGLTIVDILVPFASGYEKELIAAGTIGMYLLVILVLTSYLRNRLPARAWRLLHYLYIVVYIAVGYHALYLGTDFKSQWVTNLVYAASGVLVILALLNMKAKLSARLVKRRQLVQAQG